MHKNGNNVGEGTSKCKENSKNKKNANTKSSNSK